MGRNGVNMAVWKEDGQIEQHSNCKYPSVFHNSCFMHLLRPGGDVEYEI